MQAVELSPCLLPIRLSIECMQGLLPCCYPCTMTHVVTSLTCTIIVIDTVLYSIGMIRGRSRYSS